jgi:AhpC/TSA family protein
MAKRTLRFISALVLTATLALPSSAADKQDSSIASEYKRLNKQFEDSRQEYFKAYQKANEEERKKLKYPDTLKHAQELLALAEKNPKDPDAVDALVGALRHGRYQGNSDVAPKALELLKAHHLESEKIEAVCQMLAYSAREEENKEFLTTAIARNPHEKVKGAAALSLGQLMARKDPKQAEQHFNDVIAKYGTKEQKKTAKGELYEMHNLAVGKVAPEIKGEDVDGKNFKLSDYRGKVVVLDFWGDW